VAGQIVWAVISLSFCDHESLDFLLSFADEIATEEISGDVERRSIEK
jgi:hypothetical protein